MIELLVLKLQLQALHNRKASIKGLAKFATLQHDGGLPVSRKLHSMKMHIRTKANLQLHGGAHACWRCNVANLQSHAGRHNQSCMTLARWHKAISGKL